MTVRQVRKVLLWQALCSFLVLQAVCGFAQTASTGTLVGAVHDSSGAIVPGAQVEITNSSVGFHRQIEASTEGAYKFVQLPPGTYEVKVTASGFQTAVLSVTVNVAESALADVSLSVGSAVQTV